VHRAGVDPISGSERRWLIRTEKTSGLGDESRSAPCAAEVIELVAVFELMGSNSGHRHSTDWIFERRGFARAAAVFFLHFILLMYSELLTVVQAKHYREAQSPLWGQRCSEGTLQER
jgi:hypothetical protein